MRRHLSSLIHTIGSGFFDVLVFFRLSLRDGSGLAAENLFLRKQLGLYVERKRNLRRATDSVRFTLAQLSRLFEWREALIIVKPDTLIRWHRKAFDCSGNGSPVPSAVHPSAPMFGS
jgi:hypothetical protein